MTTIRNLLNVLTTNCWSCLKDYIQNPRKSFLLFENGCELVPENGSENTPLKTPTVCGPKIRQASLVNLRTFGLEFSRWRCQLLNVAYPALPSKILKYYYEHWKLHNYINFEDCKRFDIWQICSDVRFILPSLISD